MTEVQNNLAGKIDHIPHHLKNLEPYLKVLDSNGMIVDYTKAVANVRTSAIARYIEDRFGDRTCRVWRCILHRRVVDDKTAGTICFMELQELRARAYSLLEDGLIEFQEVPKTTQRESVKSSFLYKTSLAWSIRGMNVHLMRTLRNLSVRLDRERGINQQLLEKADGKAIPGTDKDNSAVVSATKKIKKLTTAQIRILTLLMLFYSESITERML